MDEKPKKRGDFLSSVRFTVFILIVIAAISMLGTFIQQGKEAEFYVQKYGETGHRILKLLRLTDLYSSGWFLLLLLLLMLNVVFCTLRRFKVGISRAGILLTHCSVLLMAAGVLIGGVWGEHGFVAIHEQETVDSYFDRDEKAVPLGFKLVLDDFILESYKSPHPEAGYIYIDGHKHDARVGSEHASGDTTVKVLRYVPDFVILLPEKEVTSRSDYPNNPAIEVEIRKGEESEKKWLFAKYGGALDGHGAAGAGKSVELGYAQMKPMIKDYKSKLRVLEGDREVLSKTIEVNHPLTYKGYTFYQSSYDEENLSWSGLQVSKDPGVPVVYAGFVALMLGVGIVFWKKVRLAGG